MTALVGVLGGGQLGRMLAQAAAPLGIRCRVLDPSPNACAARFAEHIQGDYDDPDALAHFCDGIDFATYEFENVPAETTRAVAERVPLRPGARSIELTQDRLVEKNFLIECGATPAPFAEVSSAAELDASLEQLGRPAVLKTRRFGYDGKGQILIRQGDDLAEARQLAETKPCVLEAFVDFTRELSVVVARADTGESVAYPPTENIHAGGILRVSIAPARRGRTSSSVRTAVAVADAINHVGALCVELFDTPDGLLVNEIAPRVHNSGHWTIDATACSQFENHMRAVVGMELGEPTQTAPAIMLNLIGAVPEMSAVTALDADAKLHLYDKAPKAGRKVGHLTLVGDDLAERVERLAEVPGVHAESARLAAERLRVS